MLLAALINAAKLTGKRLQDFSIVINGAGAAGTAIAELLLCVGHDPKVCESVKEIIVCDSKGILSRNRTDIGNNITKMKITEITNRNNRQGSLTDALRKVDVFIGVSVGNVLTSEMIQVMNPNPIILAMANPIPEIMPDLAKSAGAFVVGTGRSDFPNQVNNVLAFPGIFRGALDARAAIISNKMKISAAHALANFQSSPTPDSILPSALDKRVAPAVAKAVKASSD